MPRNPRISENTQDIDTTIKREVYTYTYISANYYRAGYIYLL